MNPKDKKKVSSFAKVRRGASPRPIDDPKFFGGTVGWVRISDVTSSHKYLRQTTQYLSPLGVASSVPVHPGDLILSICATVGRPMLVDMEACIHDGFVQLYETDADEEYLYYQLQFAEKDLSCAGQSGTQTNINTSIVNNLELYLPKRTEQEQIAAVLSCVDRAIADTERLLAKYRRIKAGLLHDLLTRGIDEHGNLRHPDTHRFNPSPLGPIPEEWEVKTLEGLTLKIADRDHTTPIYVETGIRIVSPINFRNEDEINFAAAPYITEAAHRINQKKTDLRTGDIILHRIGAGLGRVRFVTADMPEFSILHSLCLVRADRNVCTPRMLYWAFQSFSAQKQIALEIQSIGVPDLGLDKIKAFLFAVPKDTDEQEKITAAIDEHQKLQQAQRKQLLKLQRLKTGLMQDLLTGEVPVAPLLTK